MPDTQSQINIVKRMLKYVRRKGTDNHKLVVKSVDKFGANNRLTAKHEGAFEAYRELAGYLENVLMDLEHNLEVESMEATDE